MQSDAFGLATRIHETEAATQMLAGIHALNPQVGSPFAMKWGGVELAGSWRGFAHMAKGLAQMAEAMAASAGLEAGFERRLEGWRHQKRLAERDIQQLNRQIEAGSIRLQITESALVIHEKSIEQLDEQLEFMDGKFTKLGLYTWMSTQLRRLYRDGYQNALALARLAEEAFKFERGDEISPGLASTYWDPTYAGLLAGEQLLIDLQNIERRYIETNYRCLEVDQAFALSQVAPDALVQLREAGECRFTIPELFFDLFYPGHHKRRIKAVRLTIPCITGPYVNVSASLSLEGSRIRPTPKTSSLIEVPPRRSVSVATSTAQNDAGVFELSFRDERYMPFEGAGAISDWHLALPKAFRQFDYQTINDVILSISYTAEQDGVLRERVEANNAALEGSILHYLSSNPVARLFSLRQDFSSAFTRLLRSPVGTQVKIEIADRNFPLFVRGRSLQVQRGVVLVRTASGTAPTGFELEIDGEAISGFSAEPNLGNVPSHALPLAFAANLRALHTLVVNAAGDLAPTVQPPGDTSAIDSDKLLDVLLYLEYQLS